MRPFLQKLIFALISGVSMGSILLLGIRWMPAAAIGQGINKPSSIEVIIDGEPVATGVIIDGKTYVPIRVISECFGATVNYDKAANQIIIDSGPAQTLPNGTDVITPAPMTGLGWIKLKNNANRDAVVKVASLPDPITKERQLFRIVYISNNNEVTLKAITPGTYDLFFTSGKDWNANTKAFNRFRQYYSVDHHYVFTEIERGDSIVYNTVELSLNPSRYGTARLKTVEKNVFDKIQ